MALVRFVAFAGAAAILILCIAVADGAHAAGLEPRASQFTTPQVEERVTGLMARMTLEEKIALLGGVGMDTKPNARLGIPSLRMTDGPHGVRWGRATCFPTGVALASSWDVGLLEEVGVALARESVARGRNVILGPCLNIHRAPQGGRNFESFSEDPYLTSRLAVAYIKGVQSRQVVACPKHYVCNNQEWERTTINVAVDERALREIYLPAFKAAVREAGAWSVMAAYNRINGPYACANTPLLTYILKKEWGFQGLVMSDWGAVHDTVKTANAGLDLEMPWGAYFNERLTEAVRREEVGEAVIDDKVRRLLRVMAVAGLFETAQAPEHAAADTPAHRALALRAARAGIVLLKNEWNALPLERHRLGMIAVIGPNAAVARLGGGGSSEVAAPYAVSPLEGVLKGAGEGVRVLYAEGCRFPGDYVPIDAAFLMLPGKKGRGLRGAYFNNQEFQGAPVVTRTDERIDFDWGGEAPAPGLNADGFSVRWTGLLVPPARGEYVLAATSDDGSRLYLDGELLVDNWGNHAVEAKTRTVHLEAGRPYSIRFEYYEGGGAAVARLGWTRPGEDALRSAVETARGCDAAIVFAGLSKRFEAEGMDRDDLELPGRQDELIEAICQANEKTIVVLNNGTPILMDRWVDEAAAIVEAWYPGQEGGRALAEVLFGEVSPSGKLPVTFPVSGEDCPAFGNYPGQGGVVRYGEGIFVGYRHFDSRGIEPLFPFGHGLSYTTFEYGELSIHPQRASARETVTVTLELKNTGNREGVEVVQLYVRDVEARVRRPDKELKGFRKVRLKPGKSAKASFELDCSSLSFYDPARRRWMAEPGRFEILVGSSSRDIRRRGAFTLK